MKHRLIAVASLTLAVFLSYAAPAWADSPPPPRPSFEQFLGISAAIVFVCLVVGFSYKLLKRMVKARRRRKECEQTASDAGTSD